VNRQVRSIRSITAKCIAIPAALSTTAPLAQTYPAKPVRVIVPFAPGGGSDITARVMSQKLAEHFGQSFVPDNRPGAGGLVGAEVAVKSPPDGYTIMISTSSWVTAAAIHKPAFDPISNLAPIAEIGMLPPGGTSEQFARRVRSDYDRWVVVVKQAGIKPE
jgi:tripartite-type tricarboxylate transporter receptor subunit TctC